MSFMALKSLEEARKVLAMPEYREARGKIRAWDRAIAKAGNGELSELESGIIAFFEGLGTRNALVFRYLIAEEKALLEKIIKKRTGKGAIVD